MTCSPFRVIKTDRPPISSSEIVIFTVSISPIRIVSGTSESIVGEPFTPSSSIPKNSKPVITLVTIRAERKIDLAIPLSSAMFPSE